MKKILKIICNSYNFQALQHYTYTYFIHLTLKFKFAAYNIYFSLSVINITFILDIPWTCWISNSSWTLTEPIYPAIPNVTVGFRVKCYQFYTNRIVIMYIYNQFTFYIIVIRFFGFLLHNLFVFHWEHGVINNYFMRRS